MKLGRRIAMDLTVAQERHMRRAAGTARFAWNGALAEHRAMSDAARAEPDEAKRKALWPTAARLRARWAERRKAELPWSYEVTKCAGTQAVMDLCVAFDRSGKELRDAKREGRKPRRQFGAPRFKSRRRATPAFALWNDQFAITNHFRFDASPRATMRVPLLGEVRLREAVPGVGGILGCRVSERRGRWFASFQFDMDWVDGERSDKSEAIARAKARKITASQADVDDDTPPVSGSGPDGMTVQPAQGRPERVQPRHPRPGMVGAVDVGIVDAAVVSTDEGAPARHAGQRRARPDRHAAVRRLITRRQRRLARSVAKAKLAAAVAARTLPGPPTTQDVHRIKVRYSRRQDRRSRAISRLVWAEAYRRDDLLHKASAAVARSAEVVVTETLHLAGLLRNHRIARSLSEAALGRLVAMVRYKAEMLGGLTLAAPRFFPSSKRCACCGAVNASLALGQRSWACPSCGAVLDRDGNAAENLRRLGLAAVADGPVPDDLRAWERWITDARASVAEWRADREWSDDAGRGGLPRSDARGEGGPGRGRPRQGSARGTANQDGPASAGSG